MQRETEAQRCIYGFILQMPVTAETRSPDVDLEVHTWLAGLRTLAHHQCLPGCTLAGSWMQIWALGIEHGISWGITTHVPNSPTFQVTV